MEARDSRPKIVMPKTPSWALPKFFQKQGQGESTWSYFTAEPDATKHGDMLVDAKRNGEDVQMDEDEEDLVDDFHIFRDLQ